MPPESPTVARLELASMLRTQRREVSRDARSVFDLLGVSRNHLSAIENARALPTDDTLRQLTDILECGPADASHLELLLRIAKQRGWWEAFSSRVPDGILNLCGLEHGAEGIKVYDPLIVTGLLQTEDYARAIISANPDQSRLGIERAVEVRMRRQNRLRPPEPLRVTILQGETALYQEIGGREVLKKQLMHLAHTVESDDTDIDFRIQPFTSTPAGFATASTVLIFEFETPYLGDMVWTESPIQLDVIDDEEQVEIVEVNFEMAMATSLDKERSLELVHQRIRDLSVPP